MSKSVFAALIFSLSFFIAAKAEAAMVSFMVIETGLPQNGEKNVHSEIWESALMDAFFDSGHIVCNAPITRLVSKPDDILEIAKGDMKEAVEGGAEFFIVAQIDYAPETALPGEITLTMFKIKTSARIYEKQITGKNYRTNKEEFDDLKIITKGLVPFLK